MRVTIIELPPQEVSRQMVALQAVYEAIYAIPAGGGDGFAPVLIAHSQREGFRLCTAVDQEGEQIVGFGYGFTGLPGQTWRDSLAEAVGLEMAAEWLTGHFEFAEFYERQGEKQDTEDGSSGLAVFCPRCHSAVKNAHGVW